MEYITLDNSQYLMYESLKAIAPIFCKGTRNGHELKDKRNLTMNSHFIFGKLLKKTGWAKSEGTSRRCDKVLFAKSFVDSLDEVKNGSTSSEEKKEIDTPEHSFEISERLQKELTFSYAPNIITLSNNEKFQGPNGVPLEIETRGERTNDKIYFLVRDVMKAFGIQRLYNVLIDQMKDGYQENIHYKYFICKRYTNAVDSSNKTLIRRELFLTYKGVLRVLFTSRGTNAERFVDWATKSLFTLQMGTRVQKESLVANALGVTAKVIKEVFNTDANQFPCVYLFSLGLVKDLRSSMNISSQHSDESVVCKYGFTKDLTRRTGEHLSSYKKIKGVELRLKHHVYIDPQYVSSAENKISNYMKALQLGFEYADEKELVVISPSLTDLVSEQYQQIGRSYMGHITEFVSKVKDLEQRIELQELRHEKEKVQSEKELVQKNMECELLKKELEIAQLKYRLVCKE